MSAFLGPIHYWLFSKVQHQEEFTTDLLKAVLPNSEQPELQSAMASTCGKVETRPLDDCIDAGNIHGWLLEQVSIAESRFAFLVTKLLQSGRSDLEQLEQAAFLAGTKHAIIAEDAQTVYQELNDILLDGMPCDQVNEVVSQTPEQVVWRQTQCLHRGYWESMGSDVSVYNILRGKWISGMLKSSNLDYHFADGLYFIQRKAA